MAKIVYLRTDKNGTKQTILQRCKVDAVKL